MVLFLLALATLFVSFRHSYLGQTLGTCSDPYNVCPTSTSTPKPATQTTPEPTAVPVVTTTVAPVSTAPSPSVDPNASPAILPPTTIAPSEESDLIPYPDAIDTPAISNPRTLQSLISDPESGSITPQSLIEAPAAITAALYEVAYDNISAQISAFTNSISHIESPTINRFRLPAQVCTFLEDVGMQWLCE